MHSKTINPLNSTDINGIINYYFVNKQNNFDDYISITAIDTYTTFGWSGPEILLNSSNVGEEVSSNWCSCNTPGSYFILSFKNIIEISAYAFKTRTTSTITDYPTDWKVYGSIDNNTWAHIDTQECRNELSVKNGIYTPQPKVYGYFRYFKFILTTNNLKRNYFCLNRVDIFGTYYELYSIQSIRFSLNIPNIFIFVLIK